MKKFLAVVAGSVVIMLLVALTWLSYYDYSVSNRSAFKSNHKQLFYSKFGGDVGPLDIAGTTLAVTMAVITGIGRLGKKDK